MRNKIIIIIVFVSFFAVSVLVRLPLLDRPLSNHHEWLTAHTLLTLQIWQEEGALSHYFSGIMTYPGEANKNINNFYLASPDDRGNFYYISFPPFGFMLPYIIFKILGFYPNILNLQIFNLFLHFLNSLFLYLVISLLVKVKGFNYPALLGSMVYMFSSAALWFQSNVYLLNMPSVSFMIIIIYLILKIPAVRNFNLSLILYILLVLNLFLIIYTEWLGLLLAFLFLIYFIFNYKKNDNKLMIVLTVTAIIGSLGLIFIQYSLIEGIRGLIYRYIGKFLVRSGYFSNSFEANYIWDINAWSDIFNSYWDGYNYFILFIFFAFCFYLFLILIFRKTKQILTIQNKKGVIIIIIALLAVIIHHALFFNYTAIHDFSLLPDGLFLSIFTGILIGAILNLSNQIFSSKQKILMISCFIGWVFLVSISLSIVQFYYINEIGSSHYQDIGKIIKVTAQADQVVFLQAGDYFIPPQLTYYAHRNVAHFTNEQEAKELIEKNNLYKGIIFTLDKTNTKVENIKEINLE